MADPQHRASIDTAPILDFLQSEAARYAPRDELVRLLAATNAALQLELAGAEDPASIAYLYPH